MEYSFKQDLKAIRDVMNLSQEDLADKLGVEQITISRNEQGHTKPSVKSFSNAALWRNSKAMQK